MLGSVSASSNKVGRLLIAVALSVVVLGVAVHRLGKAPAKAPPPEGARGQSAKDPIPEPSASAKPAARKQLVPPDDERPKSVSAQRERMYRRMQVELGLGDGEIGKLRTIVESNKVVSQGNPEIVRHPLSRSECWDKRERAGLHSDAALEKADQHAKLCGAANMVPVYGKDRSTPPQVCIDQYEFPDLECDYPLVFASAQEAAQICRAVGKRLCDAHEWEGACAGELRPAEEEYLWDRPRRIEMEFFKNQKREKVWAYGPEKDHGKCATGSSKSAKCNGGGWETCGSNTYPSGAFPECVSAFGVYDQHGNAAEHMNLPMKAEELASRGGLGETEMKGSWFIFGREEAHPDDCRWRAPAWHATKVDYWNSHRNYHLGFRCCKDR